jgi:hypothetical protein
LIGCPIVFFSAGRLTGVFFDLPILHRIESPTNTVTTFSVSPLGIASLFFSFGYLCFSFLSL